MLQGTALSFAYANTGFGLDNIVDCREITRQIMLRPSAYADAASVSLPPTATNHTTLLKTRSAWLYRLRSGIRDAQQLNAGTGM